MSNVLVRNLPDDVHERLQHKAQARGQSLQQYLTEELVRLANTATVEEVLARIEARTGGEVGLARAAEDLNEDRIDL